MKMQKINLLDDVIKDLQGKLDIRSKNKSISI